MINVIIPGKKELPKSTSQIGSPIRQTKEGERGAISMIVAILFAGFLVTSFLALVIDVGILYQERRTLQNAADATALAIAQECSELPIGGTAILCQSSDLVPASQFAGKNSDDGKTQVFKVCGLGSSAPGLDACDEISNSQFDCKDNSLFGIEQYVRVRVKSLSAQGDPSLRLFFAPLWKESIESVSMKACAQVAWGAATDAPVVYPIALPICFYQDLGVAQHNQYISSDKFYAPGDLCPYTPVGNSEPIQLDTEVNEIIKGAVIFTGINGADSGCPSIQNPVIVRIGDLLTPTPDGVPDSIVGDCKEYVNSLGYTETQNVAYERYLRDFVLGKTLYVPVVTSVVTSDSGKETLKVATFFSVIVKGIKIKTIQVGHGKSGPTNLVTGTGWKDPPGSANDDCPNNVYCFYGKFTRTTPPGIPKKADPNQPNTGVNRIIILD